MVFWTKFAQNGYWRSKIEKSRFCARPRSLLTILNRLMQRYFDVSFLSSRRDNKSMLHYFVFLIIMCQRFFKHCIIFVDEYFMWASEYVKPTLKCIKKTCLWKNVPSPCLLKSPPPPSPSLFIKFLAKFRPPLQAIKTP